MVRLDAVGVGSKCAVADFEGLRIGCARYLVRGVRAADYARRDIMDLWLPTPVPKPQAARLGAPTRHGRSESVEHLVRRYRGEMKHTNARQTIRLLARIAQQIPISLGCHGRGTTHCHRFELERLIREAGKGS
jgi:uncharacterized protein YeaO (DUF488 family)